MIWFLPNVGEVVVKEGNEKEDEDDLGSTPRWRLFLRGRLKTNSTPAKIYKKANQSGSPTPLLITKLISLLTWLEKAANQSP